MLKELLSLQRRMMDVLGIEERGLEPSSLLTSPAFQSAATGAASEAIEVLDAMNTRARPWVSSSPEKVQALVAEEVVDLLMYDLEMFLLLGYDEGAIATAFANKFLINMARVLGSLSHEEREGAFSFALRNRWDVSKTSMGRFNDAAKLITEAFCFHEGVPEELIDDPKGWVRSQIDE